MVTNILETRMWDCYIGRGRRKALKKLFPWKTIKGSTTLKWITGRRKPSECACWVGRCEGWPMGMRKNWRGKVLKRATPPWLHFYLVLLCSCPINDWPFLKLAQFRTFLKSCLFRAFIALCFYPVPFAILSWHSFQHALPLSEPYKGLAHCSFS